MVSCCFTISTARFANENCNQIKSNHHLQEILSCRCKFISVGLHDVSHVTVKWHRRSLRLTALEIMVFKLQSRGFTDVHVCVKGLII